MDAYVLPDPTLSRYDGGVAELRRHGEVLAYLVCEVGRMVFPAQGDPAPLFKVVWPDGRQETEFEDYGPEWWTVRELDAGHLTFWSEPSVFRPVRFLGLDLGGRVGRTQGEEVSYEVGWLPPVEARSMRRKLGLPERGL
ncbi:hypothetical protein [Luteococcus sp.]|uniref:hypothetical protein n=1 Tax=Luteococcus sp. TaxID=1969402 RepID=UPI003736F38E